MAGETIGYTLRVQRGPGRAAPAAGRRRSRAVVGCVRGRPAAVVDGPVPRLPGLARFQTVKTHPDARGRGLAGTLVHEISRFGFADLDAETLVMVADPEYLAIRLYRSVGFADTEVQIGVERKPPSARVTGR